MADCAGFRASVTCAIRVRMCKLQACIPPSPKRTLTDEPVSVLFAGWLGLILGQRSPMRRLRKFVSQFDPMFSPKASPGHLGEAKQQHLLAPGA
jgi:hypothetical protein